MHRVEGARHCTITERAADLHVCGALSAHEYHTPSNDQPAPYTGYGYNPRNRPPFIMANLCHRHLAKLEQVRVAGRVRGLRGVLWRFEPRLRVSEPTPQRIRNRDRTPTT